MIKPVGHRVLVEVKVKKESKGGIVIVTDEKAARVHMETGILRAVGPNAWKAFDGGEPWAKVGDHVYFSKFGGKMVKDPNSDSDESEFFILNDEDILGLIEE